VKERKEGGGEGDDRVWMKTRNEREELSPPAEEWAVHISRVWLWPPFAAHLLRLQSCTLHQPTLLASPNTLHPGQGSRLFHTMVQPQSASLSTVASVPSMTTSGVTLTSFKRRHRTEAGKKRGGHCSHHPQCKTDTIRNDCNHHGKGRREGVELKRDVQLENTIGYRARTT